MRDLLSIKRLTGSGDRDIASDFSRHGPVLMQDFWT